MLYFKRNQLINVIYLWDRSDLFSPLHLFAFQIGRDIIILIPCTNKLNSFRILPKDVPNRIFFLLWTTDHFYRGQRECKTFRLGVAPFALPHESLNIHIFTQREHKRINRLAKLL